MQISMEGGANCRKKNKEHLKKNKKVIETKKKFL